METRNRNHILLRYALVIVGVLVFSVAIVKKAADTCIIHADKWNEKAARMLSVTHEVMPERGDILAQNGEVMATNMTYYRALIDFGVPKFKSREFNDSLKRCVNYWENISPKGLLPLMKRLCELLF